MKNTTLIGIVAASILVAGCGKKTSAPVSSVPPATPTPPATPNMPTMDFVSHEREAVAQSQVVAYCTADTNNAPDIVLTVSEIWKGVGAASTLRITNGTQFSLQWQSLREPRGPLPDAAIVIIPPADSQAKAIQSREVAFVRAGRVAHMTIQEYKTKLGL
jgi:hypothetical protein